MPIYQVLPTDRSCSPSEIVASSPAAVLNLVQRLACHEADVLRDGDYSFSVRLGDNGLWRIYQRQSQRDAGAVVPLAG
jgi:hypothetical protein